MRWQHSNWWQLGAVLILVVLISSIVFVFAPRTVVNAGVEDTPENREIVAAVQRAYDASLDAYLAEDVSILAQALADDPISEREIGRTRAAELREYIAEVSGSDRAQNLGYLNAMQNKLAHRVHGERLLAEEMAKAAAEGLTFTADDRKALAARNFGEEPMIRDVSSEDSRYVNSMDAFRSIRIEGDYAYATYERVVLWKVVLKRIDGQWFIVSQCH